MFHLNNIRHLKHVTKSISRTKNKNEISTHTERINKFLVTFVIEYINSIEMFTERENSSQHVVKIQLGI